VQQIYPAGSPGHEIATVKRGETGQAAQAAVAALAALYAYPLAALPDPWVRANMIASADGAGSLDGRSAGLSGAADRLVFSVLRSLADVILVGAGTARTEKYRPVRPAEVWAQLREGRAATPPIAVVTSRLSLEPDSPLLAAANGSSRTIVLTTAAAPAAAREAAARHADVVVTGAERVTPAGMIGALAARGYQRVLVEGGPSLLAQITAAGLLDELCLTFSPVLAGGQAGRILAAPGEGGPRDDVPRDGGTVPNGGPAAGLALAHVIEDNGSLLCRYLAANHA
jgi:riboflavin biosynthesis pyrimidine reductase